jgi:hypothetical protein
MSLFELIVSAPRIIPVKRALESQHRTSDTVSSSLGFPSLMTCIISIDANDIIGELKPNQLKWPFTELLYAYIGRVINPKLIGIRSVTKGEGNGEICT